MRQISSRESGIWLTGRRRRSFVPANSRLMRLLTNRQATMKFGGHRCTIPGCTFSSAPSPRILRNGSSTARPHPREWPIPAPRQPSREAICATGERKPVTAVEPCPAPRVPRPTPGHAARLPAARTSFTSRAARSVRTTETAAGHGSAGTSLMESTRGGSSAGSIFSQIRYRPANLGIYSASSCP